VKDQRSCRRSFAAAPCRAHVSTSAWQRAFCIRRAAEERRKGASRTVPHASISCPGRVQRARLRKRNETPISGLPAIGA
jgi:hypothetical protein